MIDETISTQQACADLLARYGVTMTATFVPQSVSRNSEEKDRTLNWRISFKRDKMSFALDYSQGIGHIPPLLRGKGYPLQMQARAYEASEKGRYEVNANSSWLTKALPIPTTADLLYCIISDVSCLEDTFEDWCGNLGYDIDSRKAERIYSECRKQSQDAQRVLGTRLLAEASTLLQDY